jgi:hypothetical protein
MGKIWDWHKRVFADDRPVLAWAEQEDEEGHKESFVWFMGSTFFQTNNPNKKLDFGKTVNMLNEMAKRPHPWDRKKIIYDEDEEE